MAGDFDDIFAGEGPGCPHDAQHYFINYSTVTNDVAVMNGMAGCLRRNPFVPASRLEAAISNGQGFRAGNTNNRKSALSEGSGDGRNGLVELNQE